MTVPLSVFITTYNEEINIEDCLKSCVGWASEVIVVDSYSTDNTIEISKRYNAKIVQHEYESPADQKNWALDNVQFENEWVLILDADERLTSELRNELSEICSKSNGKYDGYYINRRYIFYGKWIKHCGWYPSWNLRFFKHKAGRYEKRKVHEHVILNGSVGYCKNDLIHEDRRDFMDWMSKQIRFASAEAYERHQVYKRLKHSSPIKNIIFGDPVQKRRALKENIWMRLPFRSIIRFVYLYFFRLGFLDGSHGFRFCILWSILEYVILMYYWELKYYKDGAPCRGINTHFFDENKIIF